MKKTIFCIILLLYSFQGQTQDFTQIDLKVLEYSKKYNKPEKLAIQITKDFKTDLEKTRAVYTWITNNVAYDYAESGKFNFTYSSKEQQRKRELIFNRKLSKRVISKRKAVCEGYSVLFKKLCDLLNIKCTTVIGISKTRTRDIGRRKSSKHAWNMVEIDGNKHLIDATWGAGGFNEKFIKDVSYYYFMTKPEDFIKNHYPEKYSYSLINSKIERSDFLNLPLFLHRENSNLKIVSPTDGVLVRKKQGVVKFLLITDEKITHLSYKVGRKQFDIDQFSHHEGIVEFQIDITKLKGRDLIIYINNYGTLGYRLK